MSRVQCKGCDYKPSKYDTLEGYCMTCAADKIKMSEQSDHDLLIRIDERTERLEKWSSNHDVHHFRYNILAWGVALSAIVTLAIALIKLL